MQKHISKTAAGKVRKPRNFPLFQHSRRYWAKKVKGRTEYFGPVRDDPKGVAALKRWLDSKDDLLAGRRPRPVNPDAVTVRSLANHFLTYKQQARDAGELAPRTFDRYYNACQFLIKAFGENRPLDDLAPDEVVAHFREWLFPPKKKNIPR